MLFVLMGGLRINEVFLFFKGFAMCFQIYFKLFSKSVGFICN